MHNPAAGTTRLLVVPAAIQLLTGLAIYLIPSQSWAAFYAPLLAYFPYLSTALLASGVLLLMQARSQMRSWVERLLPVLPAAVFGFMALQIGASGGVSGAIVYGVIGLTVLILPWLRSRFTDAQYVPDLFNLTFGLIQLLIGLAMFLAPDSFSSAGFSPLQGLLPLLGGISLISALLLIVPELQRAELGRWEWPRRLCAAILPLVLVLTFSKTGAWSGVVVWLPLLVGVLAGRVKPHFMQRREAAPTALGPGELDLARLERLLEGWLWLMAILVVAITTLPGTMTVVASLRISLFVVIISGYNFMAHWLWSRVGTLKMRSFTHLAVLTVALGLLVVQIQPIGYSFLAMLVVIPTLVTRLMGPSLGRTLLWVVIAVLVVGGLVEWLVAQTSFSEMVSRMVLQLLILLGASFVGFGTVMQQRRLAADLVDKHQQLQAAYEDLQMQDEELQSQQEELQAQHEELLDQRALLLTQQDQLEDALQSSLVHEEERARMVAILEATTDFVVIANWSGYGLYFNKAAYEILGVELHVDPQRVHVFSCFPERLAGFAREIIAPALKQDGIWSGETVLQGYNQRETPVSMVAIAHRNVEGQIGYISAVARNIGDRKEAEMLLRGSEERFRSAFEHAPTGVVMIDFDIRFLQVNRAFCEMLGYAAAELIGQTTAMITYPGDLGDRQNIERLKNEEIDAVQLEKRYVHKLGHLIWAQIHVSLVRDADGVPDHLISHISDITERKLADEQLVHIANHDSLTGLINRRRFTEELERCLADNCGEHTRGAVLFLDLDQFKYVNDSMGHQAGDALLRGLAKLLRSMFPVGHTVARLGGDEFGLLLPGVCAQEALDAAAQTVKAVREHVEEIQGQSLELTASIGIALFPDQGSTVEEILARADVAMYQAKEDGRNGYCLYGSGSQRVADMEAKLLWERRIRVALEQDRFVLHCQPLVDLRTNQVTQYELLLRMVGENGELIYPGAFLDVAERFGLIHAIDRWVVTQAIGLIAAHNAAGRELCLEVNLSGKAFGDDRLLPLIRDQLAATGIKPASLVLEITETAAIIDTAQARRFVETLQELGCRFALDDFGAGFSSFYYLKHLPVDYLKIDGSFIEHLVGSPVDQHLVKAMVEVARGLGIQTVAEFVSDEATVQLLRELGVDTGQGYYIGYPGGLEGLGLGRG